MTKKAIWLLAPVLLLFYQGCVTYPAVGSFGEYNELYKGTVTVNLFTLSSDINIEGVSSKILGKGSSWITSVSPSLNCEGTKGGVLLKFSDGRIVNAEFTCLSCNSGWGGGKDQGGNTFTFTFGMTDEEAEQFIQKTYQVASHSSVPAAGGEPQKEPEPVEFEYNPETKMGYISVKGKGPEARSWMLKQIEEICASKNIVIQEGEKPSEPARFRVLSETFLDGKFTIKFELVR